MSKNQLKKIQSLKTHSDQKNSIIADQCKVAHSFFDRLIGLIGTRKLESGQGLMITRCNSIHMWFMSIPIDVVFVSRKKTTEDQLFVQVVALKPNLTPWHPLPVGDLKASDALELPIGTISLCDIRVGDELCIS